MQLYNELRDKEKKIAKELLLKNNVDLSTEYGAYTAQDGKPQSIELLLKNNVDLTSQEGWYLSTLSIKVLEEYFNNEVIEVNGKKYKLIK